jgi:hypothetical protein
MTAPVTRARVRAALLAGVCGVLLAGCGGPSWREEVITSAGEHIVVQRQVIEGSRFDQELSNIRFGPPIRGHVLRAPKADGTWTKAWEPMGLWPQAIGRVDGTLYLSARPMRCEGYETWGRPIPPYVFFRYGNDAWERIPIEQFPASIAKRNLVYASPNMLGSIGGTRYVSTEQAKYFSGGLSDASNNVYREGIRGVEDCWKDIRLREAARELRERTRHKQ